MKKLEDEYVSKKTRNDAVENKTEEEKEKKEAYLKK